MKYASVSDIESLPNEFPLFDTIEEATKDNLYPYLIEVEDKNQIENLKDFESVPYDMGNRTVIKLAIGNHGQSRSKRITIDAFRQIQGTPLARHVLEDAEDNNAERKVPDSKKVNFYAVDIINRDGRNVEMRWGKPDPRHEDVLPGFQDPFNFYAGVGRNLSEKRDENGESMVGQLVSPHVANKIAKALNLNNAAAMLRKAGTSKAYILDPKHDYPHEVYALRRHAEKMKLNPQQLDEMSEHHASLVPTSQWNDKGDYVLAPTKEQLKQHAIQKAVLHMHKVRLSNNKEHTKQYFEEPVFNRERLEKFLKKLSNKATFDSADIDYLDSLKSDLTPGKIKHIFAKYGIDINNKDIKKRIEAFRFKKGDYVVSKIVDDAKKWYKKHTNEDVDISPEDIHHVIKETTPIFTNKKGLVGKQREYFFKKLYDPKYKIEFRPKEFPNPEKFDTILNKPVPVNFEKSVPLVNAIMDRVKETYDFHKNRVNKATEDFQTIEKGLKEAFKTNSPLLKDYLSKYEASFDKLKEAKKERDAMLITYIYAKTGMRPGYNEDTNSNINKDVDKINEHRIDSLSRHKHLDKEPIRGAALLELGDVDLSRPNHVAFSFPSKTKNVETKSKLTDFTSTGAIHDPFMHKFFTDKKKEIEDRVNFENELGKDIATPEQLRQLFPGKPSIRQRWEKALLDRKLGTPSKYIRFFNHDPSDFDKAFGLHTRTEPVETPLPQERSFIPLFKVLFGEKYNVRKDQNTPGVQLTPYHFRKHVFTGMANVLGYKVGYRMFHEGEPFASALTKSLKEVEDRLAPFTSHSLSKSLSEYLKPGDLARVVREGYMDAKSNLPSKIETIREELYGHL